MIRLGLLPKEFKSSWDSYLYKLCREGKPATFSRRPATEYYLQEDDALLTERIKPMWKARSWWVYKAVNKFGKPAVQPKNRKVTIEI